MSILSHKTEYDFNDFGVSTIQVGGHDFVPFIKILERYDIPYIVMCDKDVLMDIGRGKINYNGAEIKTSSFIHKLDELGRLSDDDKSVIKSIEHKIQIVIGSNGKERSTYIAETEDELRKIANKESRFIVLSSDFEDAFKTIPSYKQLFTEAKQNFGASKVLQGRYIAENISSLPDELHKVIIRTCNQKAFS